MRKIKMNFFQLRESLDLNETFKLPNPPMKGMVLSGFKAKFKINQQAYHDDNYGKQVVDDYKKAIKIVDKHLKKLGMKPVPAIFVGPKDTAKENGIKVGGFAGEFTLEIFPGFSGNIDTKGKEKGDFDLSDMVKELGKLKSFVNFPKSDWQDNWA